MSIDLSRKPLPANFRKISVEQRILLLKSTRNYNPHTPQPTDSETMIESAVGYSEIPLGVAPRVLVNSKWYAIPMATEEPSVVAAQMMAAAIIARHGGVESTAGAALGIGQIFIKNCSRTQYRKVASAQAKINNLLEAECESLQRRGGGVRGSHLCWQRAEKEKRIALFEFTVDTVDAMGANRIILLAERVAHWLRNELDCEILMAILSNDLAHSPSRARFCIPISAVRAITANPTHTAQNIVAANAIAHTNRRRAVTHNKGIMNGICALSLATGNDTRAVEAAAHSYAAISGHYRSLTNYRIAGDKLYGELTLPLPLATVGGAIDTQNHAKQAAAILQITSAAELKEIAAAVGLQQNFAALLALTDGGISRGHMPLQQRRRSTAHDPSSIQTQQSEE